MVTVEARPVLTACSMYRGRQTWIPQPNILHTSHPMELPHTVWFYLDIHIPSIGCVIMLPGNEIRMIHHRHCIFHVSY